MVSYEYFTFVLLMAVLACFVSGIKDEEFNIEPRIIGGRNIDISRAPYMASLQYWKKKNVWDHRCGGSIIAPTIILTAAHCCEKSYRVKVGATAWAGNEGFVSQILYFIIHEKYDEATSDYDVGLLFLASALPIGGNIQIMELTSDTFPPNHIHAFVSGWGGITCDENQMSPVLKGLNVTVFSQAQCIARLPHDFNPGDNLCAGKRNGTVLYDVFAGDSGGPLVYNNRQIGIASTGLCKLQYHRTISTFVNVGYHRAWINKQTGV